MLSYTGYGLWHLQDSSRARKYFECLSLLIQGLWSPRVGKMTLWKLENFKFPWECPHFFHGQIISRCIISLVSCLATGKGTTRSISEFQTEIRTNDHKLCVLTNHLLLKNSLALLQDNETIGGKECVLSSKKYNHQHQWRQNYKIGVNTVKSWISCTGIRTSTAKAMLKTAKIIHTHSNPHFWYMKFTY